MSTFTQSGPVVWFSQKGYGFIARPGKKDLFFHCRSMLGAERQANIGDVVSYDLGKNLKGECAVNVVIDIRA